MSSVYSGAPTPFETVTVDANDMDEAGLDGLTELPVPTSIPDILNAAVSVIENTFEATVDDQESEPELDGFGAGAKQHCVVCVEDF